MGTEEESITSGGRVFYETLTSLCFIIVLFHPTQATNIHSYSLVVKTNKDRELPHLPSCLILLLRRESYLHQQFLSQQVLICP